MYFDGVGTLSVEVSEWEILLYLLEKGLYGPSGLINRYDFLEFGIVNVSPVYGKDVALVQFSWTKHEMVVRGR